MFRDWIYNFMNYRPKGIRVVTSPSYVNLQCSQYRVEGIGNDQEATVPYNLGDIYICEARCILSSSNFF